MAGRPPYPTRLKVLTGNPGRRPLNDREPQPQAFTEACPDWLPAYAREEWQRVVPVLTACRVLTAADYGVLTVYCLAFDEVRRAVEAKGTLDRTAAQILRSAGNDLGLSPSARSRVVAAAPDEEKDATKYFIA